MAFEELGNIETVILGGTDKKTGKRNATELEGYLVGIEQRPNRFNPAKPQNYYIFQTPDGLKGTYGKAGIDSVLKGAMMGVMTKLVATGQVKDTGKGNPMKVFKGFQDRSNHIDVTGMVFGNTSDGEETTQYADTEELEDTSLDAEEVAADEVVPARASAPKQPAQAPNAARVAQVQAMLSKNRVGTKTV